MERVSARPLEDAERALLVADKARPPGRGMMAGGAVYLFVLLPAVGGLAAINLGAALGYATGPSALTGFVVVALVNLFWIRPALGGGRAMAVSLREDLERQLADAEVETWDFEPVRGWAVTCGLARVVLLESDDGRLVLLASTALEVFPPGTRPRHVRLDAVPRLERLLRLDVDGTCAVDGAFAFEELGGMEYPMKKRRFAELSPGALPEQLRLKLGVDASDPALPDLPPRARRRATPWSEPWDKLHALVPPAVQFRARAWTWAAPAIVLALLALTPWLPAPARTFLRSAGVIVSLVPVGVAAFLAGAIHGDRVRRRAMERVLAGDVTRLPAAWQAAGPLVHHEGRVTSPGVAMRRIRHVFVDGGMLEADDFVLDGQTVVAVEHAWLFEGDVETWLRLDPGDRLALGASVGAQPRLDGRRFTWHPVDEARAGDFVHVVGFRDPAGARLRGTPAWPLLVWTSRVRTESLS